MCGTHTRGFCCYRMIPDHVVIRSAANAAWVMTQRNPHITYNIKGRLKNNFQTASLYRKQPALSKIEVQAAFCDDWKKRTLFLSCMLCRHNAKQHYPKESLYLRRSKAFGRDLRKKTKSSRISLHSRC